MSILTNLNLFSRSIRKTVTVKKYKKLSYEESILEAARELKNISTIYNIVSDQNRNLIHTYTTNKSITKNQQEAIS